MADLPECAQPGCGVKGSWASFVDAEDRHWCISHNPDGRAKQDAVSKGGDAKRRKERKVLPPDSPDPDWSSPKALRAWAEQRAGAVERGELDKKVIPEGLARLLEDRGQLDTQHAKEIDSLQLACCR